MAFKKSVAKLAECSDSPSKKQQRSLKRLSAKNEKPHIQQKELMPNTHGQIQPLNNLSQELRGAPDDPAPVRPAR